MPPLQKPQTYWQSVHGIERLLALHERHAAPSAHGYSAYLTQAGQWACRTMHELCAEPGLLAELDAVPGTPPPEDGYTEAVRATTAKVMVQLGYPGGAAAARDLVERAHALMLMDRITSGAHREQAMQALAQLRDGVCEAAERLRVAHEAWLQAESRRTHAGRDEQDDRIRLLLQHHAHTQEQAARRGLRRCAWDLFARVANAASIIGLVITLHGLPGTAPSPGDHMKPSPVATQVQMGQRERMPASPRSPEPADLVRDALRFGLPRAARRVDDTDAPNQDDADRTGDEQPRD